MSHNASLSDNEDTNSGTGPSVPLRYRKAARKTTGGKRPQKLHLLTGMPPTLQTANPPQEAMEEVGEPVTPKRKQTARKATGQKVPRLLRSQVGRAKDTSSNQTAGASNTRDSSTEPMPITTSESQSSSRSLALAIAALEPVAFDAEMANEEAGELDVEMANDEAVERDALRTVEYIIRAIRTQNAPRTKGCWKYVGKWSDTNEEDCEATLTKDEEIEYNAQIQEFWKHMSTMHRMDRTQLEEGFMAPQPLEAMQNWREQEHETYLWAMNEEFAMNK